jgi:hypothetical protein
MYMLDGGAWCGKEMARSLLEFGNMCEEKDAVTEWKTDLSR